MSRLGRLREPLTFYAVGALNTAVDFLGFSLLSGVLGVPYLVAQVVSYTAGAANSYAMNRTLTFRAPGRPAVAEAGRFAAANALSLASASALLVLLHQAAGMQLIAAKGLSVVLSALLNYAMNRMWVFAPAQAARPAAPGPAQSPR